MSISIHDYLVCDSCDAAISQDDHEAGPLYECSSCGDVFTRSNSADGDSNRCPSCGKLSRKEADYGCEDCNEPMEVKAGIICDHCDKFIPEED